MSAQIAVDRSGTGEGTWSVIAISALIQGVAAGTGFYLFAQLVTPIEDEFGATRAGIMLAPTLGSLVGAAASPIVGTWVDRGRIRGIVVTGAVLIALGWSLVALSQAL